MSKNLILAAAAVFVFAACSQTMTSSASTRKVANVLEKTYADYRSALVSNVHYKLTVDITKPDTYSGTQEIRFDLAKPSELSIDFADAKLASIVVNGKALKDFSYNNFFVTLPQNTLVKGANVVQITFDHPYNTTGSGLYRNVDPQDKRAYLYTDFEPYDAHVFMPCFDQPNLKATYILTVTAPKDWTVVSSTRETNIAPNGDSSVWTFPETDKFSTYLFSLHAGPYKVWSKDIVTKAHTIPHRVMVRQSLAKYIDQEEWFKNIQNGFEFYEAYFDFAYPFKKYDEIIVPDFNSGAMENVGAVTFSERYVSRGERTRDQHRNLASTQLHELAHMWFGDLVTMKWWNDIWLNESFATYASYRAMKDHTEYAKDADLDFIRGDKTHAYFDDQLVTTHPIEFTVPDTDVVFANFDGITYGKGASVLKQLNFFLGDEAFKKGVQNYFKDHQFANAELTDFTGALEKSSGQKLDQWRKDWLKVAQVNTIKVDYKCENNQTQDVTLTQTANKDYPTLRQHKTQVGVFAFENGKLRALKSVDVSYSGATTPIADLNGLSCDKIALVYPNYGDQDYALVDLDAKSLETVMTKISSVDDDVLRFGLWSSLSQMVIAQKIPATQLFEVILAHAEKEKTSDVLQANVGNALAVPHYYLAKDDKMGAERSKDIARLSDYFMKNAKSAKDKDLQREWYEAFVANAELPKDLDTVKGFLDKTPAWLKFPIDQDERWELLRELSSKGYKDVDKLVEAEKKHDTSSRAEKSVLAVQAAAPNLETKKELFNKVSAGPTTEFPLGKIGPVAGSLFPRNQEDLHRQFSGEFFKNLQKLKGQPGEFLGVYVRMAPAFCATDSVNQLRKFVDENSDLPPRVLKSLKIDAQMSERCVGIRQKILDSATNKTI